MAAMPHVTAIARILRGLGLTQGRGRDFRVTGDYQNGERIGTFVVVLTAHADEVIAEHADEIEHLSDEAGYPYRVSVRYDKKERPMTTVANYGGRVREVPPAAAAALEEPAKPEPAPAGTPPTPLPEVDERVQRRFERTQAGRLGWSEGQADLVLAAADSLLYRHPVDGTLRRQDMPGAPGRVVSDHRLRPLVEAGFLVIGEPDAVGRRRILVTADGRTAARLWRKWQPVPADKTRSEELAELPPLFRGAEAHRRMAQWNQEEVRREAQRIALMEAQEELYAWEERQARMLRAWQKVNEVSNPALSRVPAGWVPTDMEVRVYGIPEQVVDELREEAVSPQPKPKLPDMQWTAEERPAALEADISGPEQLDLLALCGA
ncbi:hypothetical protein AQJ30_15655 [Streptomyces longwoodensis]|uniref:Uncharacterized protein n=1 Tax=Streptomyces longwoodensis TaxID=68231 RepID=A0A101QXC1_9ACTN|nr:hypothetical protein [Streptomyces longwoodensis]KUN37718.1 hypothetical protein AQJ30_15655 [Streptomyces longwoodensis]